MENAKVVMVLALSSGEHIITEAFEANNAYVCSNPVQIVSQGDPSTGQMQMGLVPYLPFTDPDGGVAIPTNMAILAIPSESLLNHYQKMFGLIVTPPAPKIILS